MEESGAEVIAPKWGVPGTPFLVTSGRSALPPPDGFLGLLLLLLLVDILGPDATAPHPPVKGRREHLLLGAQPRRLSS